MSAYDRLLELEKISQERDTIDRMAATSGERRISDMRTDSLSPGRLTNFTDQSSRLGRPANESCLFSEPLSDDEEQ